MRIRSHSLNQFGSTPRQAGGRGPVIARMIGQANKCAVASMLTGLPGNPTMNLPEPSPASATKIGLPG